MRELGLAASARGKVRTHHDRRPGRGPARPTWSSATSAATGAEPAVGGRHHLRAAPGRGWSTWRSSSTSSPAGSWAGGPSTSLRTDLVLDALEHGHCGTRRDGRDLTGLVHHSDRGVQYPRIRYTERLAEAGVVASVGTVGDSYDNALAETLNGLYKTELIQPRGPWRTVDQVELATLDYVDWCNHRRLYET